MINTFEEHGKRKRFDGESGQGSLINLEYQVGLIDNGTIAIPRTGGFVEATKEEIRFNLSAAILFRTNGYRDDQQADYRVLLRLMSGETQEREHVKQVYLNHTLLQSFCRDSFPGMGIVGNVDFGTTPRLPGDFTLEALMNNVIGSFKSNPEIGRLSLAHKAFLDAYSPKQEEYRIR